LSHDYGSRVTTEVLVATDALTVAEPLQLTTLHDEIRKSGCCAELGAGRSLLPSVITLGL